MLYTLIPAAGNGRRFTEAGYTGPKPMLPVYDKNLRGFPMFHWVADLSPAPEQVIVATSGVWPGYKEMGGRHTLIPFFRTTRGQAETVELMAGLVPEDSEILVMNCDQITDYPMEAFVSECHLMNADAGVLTMKADNPAYSYVEGRPWVTGVAEKKVISEDAVAGFYWFKSAAALRGCVIAYRLMTKDPELFLTPVLAMFTDVLNVPMGSAKFTTWGTPEDYERNKHVLY